MSSTEVQQLFEAVNINRSTEINYNEVGWSQLGPQTLAGQVQFMWRSVRGVHTVVVYHLAVLTTSACVVRVMSRAYRVFVTTASGSTHRVGKSPLPLQTTAMNDNDCLSKKTCLVLVVYPPLSPPPAPPAPTWKRCVVNGQITKASNKWERPPPPLPPPRFETYLYLLAVHRRHDVDAHQPGRRKAAQGVTLAMWYY